MSQPIPQVSIKSLVAMLQAQPPEQIEALKKFAVEATGHLKWVPNPGPQTSAFECLADQVLYGGQAGGGKLQSIDNKVLTPFGWVAIGSLRVGSKLCATDGTVTEVIGVFPKGEVDLYRVTMRDGGSTEAGLEHNWLAWRTDNNRKIGNVRVGGPASAAKWTTAEIKARLEQAPRSDGRPRGFAIPLPDPVALNVAGVASGPGTFIGRPIDPYFLGLLIGDGSVVREQALTVTSMDDEIACYLRDLAKDDLRVGHREGSAASSFVFRGKFRKKLWDDLESLGLAGSRAVSKSIPRQYLFAHVEVRWALLQGLMDTDGWVEPKRACYYTTISKQLADDVTHLARSLGAVVSLTDKEPTYTYQGETRDGQKAYCLRIRIDDPARCFRLLRKKEIAAEIEHQSEGRFIEKIEFSRRAEAVCIAVRHPNSLYITDDFIVTHNTDILIGKATQRHKRSLILRRQNKEVEFLVDRTEEILGHSDGYNGQQKRWYLPDGRLIMFGGCQHPGDERGYKGEPKDFIGIDEASEFLESQIEFLAMWLRSTDVNQQVQLMLATNPPDSAEGEWLIKWFGPWVDPDHPLYPQPDGKLLYFERRDDDFFWSETPFSIETKSGRTVRALSRTFIRSTLDDNPDYADTDYADRLASAPEELRARYERGEFVSEPIDDEWQVIPTLHVLAAQERWKVAHRLKPGPPENVAMTAMGADIAVSKDRTVLSPVYNTWFAPQLVFPGKQTSDGAEAAMLMIKHLRDGAQINLDMSGGWGSSCYEFIKHNDLCSILGVVSSEAAVGKSACGKFRFRNKRAEMMWRLREALDPLSGFNLMLPPDPELRAELCAAKWIHRNGVITIQEKEEIKKLLQRSPDKADALALAWYSGKHRQRALARKTGGSAPHRLQARTNDDRKPSRYDRHAHRRNPGSSSSSGEQG